MKQKIFITLSLIGLLSCSTNKTTEPSLINTEAIVQPVKIETITEIIKPNPIIQTYKLEYINKIKLTETNFSYPVVYNKDVEHWIKYFTKGKGKKYFAKYMIRGEKYLPFLHDYIKNQGMPLDMAYLPLIESGFSNYAQSHAKAVGLWQFIQKTGTRFNLVIGPFIDERRNPHKATLSAIAYLNELYNEFQDWNLALASYNCGEERVRKAIIESGSTDYWELVRKRLIPKETSQYVPKMIAAIILSKNPKQFHLNHEYINGNIINPNHTEDDPNWLFFNVTTAKIKIENSTDLIKLSKALNLKLSDLKTFNPEIVGWFSPKNYELSIPINKLTEAQSIISENKIDLTPEYFKLKIKSNTNLKKLAKNINLSEDVILDFNQQIEVNQTLKKGMTLLLPIPKIKPLVAISLGFERNPKKKIKY